MTRFTNVAVVGALCTLPLLASAAAAPADQSAPAARQAAARPGSQPSYPTDRVLSLREQAPLVHGWIAERFARVLPGLMRREGIDLWIIVSREYNDDPVFRSMAPLTTF